MAAQDSLVKEVTEEEAFALSDIHQGTIKITNEARIRQIEIKQRRGIELSAEDIDALDPDSDTPGFGRPNTLRKLDRKLKAIAGE